MTDSESSSAHTPKRRHPLLAAILSGLLPGLGQLYNGNGRRAVAYMIAFGIVEGAFAIIFVRVSLLLTVLEAAALVGLLLIALYAAAVIDAYRTARRIGAVSSKPYQRIWIYGGLILLFALPSITPQGLLRHSGCGTDAPRLFSRAYTLPSSAMLPAFASGDMVGTDARYFCTHDPEPGDLAVFLVPSDGDAIDLERIIGMPGDYVQISAGQLVINGVPVEREWLESAIHTDESGDAHNQTEFAETLPNGRRYHVLIEDAGAPLENTGLFQVPPDHYFVLGDNRDNAQDSRVPGKIGFVPRADIVDRPALILWSDDWTQIGQWIE